MTPEKQRIAIAEECGWQYDDATNQMVMIIGGDICGIDWPSLDAIILAVKSLPNERLLKVLGFLQIIVTDDPLNSMNKKSLATADQWSEAFLRGVGRWEE